MANDLNKCMCIGRLGRDPELKHSSGGTAVVSISLACGWKTKDKEGVEWVRVVAWGQLAEIIGEYLRKGSQIYIEGRLQTRDWEKDGVKRYTTEIVASSMQMLDFSGSRSDRDEPRHSDNKAADMPDDDIPF